MFGFVSQRVLGRRPAPPPEPEFIELQSVATKQVDAADKTVQSTVRQKKSNAQHKPEPPKPSSKKSAEAERIKRQKETEELWYGSWIGQL